MDGNARSGLKLHEVKMVLPRIGRLNGWRRPFEGRLYSLNRFDKKENERKKGKIWL